MAESGVPAAETSQVSRSVLVFDCRPENKEASGKMLDIGGTSYKQFLCAVRKVGGFLLVPASHRV